MTLQDAINEYVAWQQAHGCKFTTPARILKRFAKHVGGQVGCDDVSEAEVFAFLIGNGRATGYRVTKQSVLTGFYRFAISRGYAERWPLPETVRRPPSAPPYVYSHEEVRRLFGAIEVSRRGAVQLDAPTFRTFLLLLYGAALRVGEARHLTLADVELEMAVMTIRNTKFYKSRLVPVGAQLADALREYAVLRASRPMPDGRQSSFLANRDGTPLAKGTVHYAFAQLRRAAGVLGTDDARQSPHLHSFRHTFAVHRLTDWYRQGADVQRLLPPLSTYLGHAGLEGTQVYLSMTPQLLRQASLRFERFTQGGGHE
ncbi:MAG: tyrosine-type recombinase/integrase [Rhodospirillaceae bacterium]|nr:tyrosine-type recombinase/integrase [Rhodospirillaceae bacterium]MDE0442203.1 tyrosine-type recombinase/integrase [Gammaproteobacteria bacterium]